MTLNRIAARERVRLTFDSLWRGEGAAMTRDEAYAWLGRVLGIRDPKLARLDVAQCRTVLLALQARLAAEKAIDRALAAARAE